MRIPLSCMKCAQQGTDPNVTLAEVREDGLYALRCEQGHESVTCLQEMKFEVLFELAAYAILDGYYRDAVSSFTASLERFYEFYISVICDQRGLHEEQFVSTWKRISAQSERQLGAFVFLYLSETKSEPELLSNKHTQFRNEVIHKGRIPYRDEAVDYGNSVLELIAPVLQVLKENSHEQVQRIVHRHVSDARRRLDTKLPMSTMCLPTTLSISRGATMPQPSLEDTLERLVRFRRTFMSLATRTGSQ